MVGTPVTPNRADDANTTAPLGGTTASGDLNVAYYGCNAASSCAVTTPLSGYTTADSRAGGAQKLYVDWKASGVADADPTVTDTVGSSGDQFFGGGLILRGVNTTTPVHASVNSAPAQASNALATPALTITANNTYVCLFVVHGSATNVTAFGAFNPNGTGNWTQHPALFYNTTTKTYVQAYCSLQTTATSISAGSIGITGGTNGAQARMVMVAFAAAAVTPTFTSAPAIGTRTTSSIPINFTSDTTGTVYGARLTDGSATPTCDQLEAQTATGGVQYASEAVVATVADTLTFGSITDGTVTDGYFCIEDGSGNDSAVAAIANMYKQPAFPVAPNVSARSSTTQTVSYQLDGPGTVYVTGAAKGKGASTYAQCAAGQDSGSAATTNNNESTSGAADSIVLTYSSPLLVKDINVCATYGSQQSSVTTLATEIMGAESGYDTPTTLASISSDDTNPFGAYNAVNSPDFAVGSDYRSCSTATSPDNKAITWTSDGMWSYPPTTARQSFNCKMQDVSAFGMFAGANPQTYYINNEAPVYSPPAVNSLWRIGDTISVNYCDLAIDAEGDTLTGSNSSTGTGSGAAKRPAGTSFGGTNICVLSGTLTTAATGSFVFTATDIVGDSATLTDSWEVRAAQETVPDCATDNLSVSACDGLMSASYLLTDIDPATVCDNTLPAYSVLSQDPAAGELADPDSVVALTVSKRCGNAGYRLPTNKISISLGL